MKILLLTCLLISCSISAQRQVVFDNDCVQTYGSVVTPITITKQLEICEWGGTHVVNAPRQVEVVTLQVELLSNQPLHLPYGYGYRMDGPYVRIYMDPDYYIALLNSGISPEDQALNSDGFCNAIPVSWITTPYDGFYTTFNQ